MKLLVFILLVGVGCYFRYFSNYFPIFNYQGEYGAEIIGWTCILGVFFNIIWQGKDN